MGEIGITLPEAVPSQPSPMRHTSDRIRGLLCAMLAGVIFGTAAIFTRVITGLSPLAIAAGRLTLGWLGMAGLIVAQGRVHEARQLLRQHPVMCGWLGILASLHFWLFVLAVQATLVANALVLVNTAPILVLVLAPALLCERISAGDLLSVGLTVLGAAILVGFDTLALTTAHLIGDLCALGSALCYALYVIAARKLRQTYAASVLMGWFFGLGALFLWLGGWASGAPLIEPAAPPSPQSWLFLLLLGLLPTGLGHLLYNISLKYLPAAQASTIILLEPVSGTLLAWLCFREAPSLLSGLGLVIVLIGIGLPAFIRR
jgi:drug/metabolite transporter (DMT)-like permease